MPEGLDVPEEFTASLEGLTPRAHTYGMALRVVDGVVLGASITFV
jgi:hypothetical protein